MAAVMLLLAAASAQAAPPDKPANTWVTNGSVFAMAPSADGNTLYLGGSFTRLGPRTGPGVGLAASSGAVASGLPELAGGTASAVIADGTGGWYVGGNFKHAGATDRTSLVHILSDGSVDPAFDAHVVGTVTDIALSGGVLYLAGFLTSVGGDTTRTRLAAVDAGTGALAAWNPTLAGGAAAANALAASGSTVYVGGSFTSIGGQPRNGLAAVTTTGTVTTWDPNPQSGGSASVTALAISGSTVYVGGIFTKIGHTAPPDRLGLGAVDATSGDATAWNPNSNGDSVTASVLVADGTTIYIGGAFSALGGQARHNLAEVNNSSGTPLGADPNADGSVETLVVSHAPVPTDQAGQLVLVGPGPATAVYAGGNFAHIGGQARNFLARLNTGLSAADTWDPNPNHAVGALALALSPTGEMVYAGGTFTSFGGVNRNQLAAIDVATGAATAWNPLSAPVFSVEALAVSGGTVYASGPFGGLGRNGLAAFRADTGALLPWNPDVGGGPVNALAASSDGSTIYAGGGFATIAGVSQPRLAALDATTGTERAAFTAPSPDNTVETLAVSGQTLYAGGSFQNAGGQPRNRAAALDATTGVAAGWNPNASSTVFALAPLGSLVYAGGGFATIGGATRNLLAALDTGTGAASAFDPNVQGSFSFAVRGLAATGTTVYAGGDFTTVGGQARSRLAAVDASTGVPTSWDPHPAFTVQTLVLTADGTLWVGGNFARFDRANQEGVAAFPGAGGSAPASVSPPEISGTPSGGQTLSCSQGTWTGSPTSFAYQWLRDGTAIAGATASTYAVGDADTGHQLVCEVTATNANGSAVADSPGVSVPTPSGGGPSSGDSGGSGGTSTPPSSGGGTTTSLGSPGGGVTPPPPAAKRVDIAPAAIGLPAARGCVDTRKFTFKIHQPAGQAVVSVVVLVNGKRVLTQRGAKVNTIALKRLPKGTFVVQIEDTAANGDVLVTKRTYRGCTKSNPKGRRHRR